MKLSRTVDVEDGRPKELLGFNIASQWQNLPEIIQQRFVPPTDLFFVAYFMSSEGKPRYISHIMLEKNRQVTHTYMINGPFG